MTASEREQFEQHLVEGGELLRSDRVEDARRAFEAALALRPDDHKALGLVGLACFRLQAFGDAQTVYEKLVDAFPDDASYRLNLGLVHLKIGEPARAIAELKRTRELDPSMSRAVTYLGLAHARAGEYLEAYRAFRHVGQDELAAEMAGYLTPEQIRAAEAPAPRQRAARTLPPPAPGARAGREVETAVEREPDRAAAHEVDAAIPTREADVVAEAEEVDTQVIDRAPEVPHPVATAAGEPGVISQALEVASPAAAAETAASRSYAGHSPPVSISEFATARLIRPDDGDHPFEIAAGGLLIVRVRGRVLSRTEGVVVSGGELAYELATRRVRGAQSDAPFSGERPLFVITGDGYLVAAPIGHSFAAVRLDDEVLYVREDLVFAFEDQLRWENGYVPGSDAQISVVQFRGQGCVAIRTRKPTLALKLVSERVLYVDAEALAGWVGRVVPRVVAPAAAGEASALFVECSGEGVVLLDHDPSAPPVEP
jgi:tetratricopeptide (TPR) repeat protein